MSGLASGIFNTSTNTSDAKTEPKLYPKQSKWSAHGSQNERRDLQRHPRRTGSNKYTKKVLKYANPGGLFLGSKSIKALKIPANKSLKDQSRKNIKKMIGKRCPNGRKKSWIFQVLREMVTFGNCRF